MLTKDLYPYQNKIVDKFLERGNLLLAADMGTGKTAMSIACAEELFGSGKIDMCLIVCPAALQLQWAQQLATWCDHVDVRTMTVKSEEITVPTDEYCVVLRGNATQREKQCEKILAAPPEYVVVSYDQVLSDWVDVSQFPAGLIVLDEASAIKNFKADRTQAIKQLSASHRMALSGTAVEKRPEDVFSIMEWVDDTVLGNAEMFDKAFIVRNKWGSVLRYKNLDVLHKKLQPVMARIRTTDPEVAPYMPDLREHTWRVNLDGATARVYQHLARDLYWELMENPPTAGNWDLWAHYSGTEDSGANGRIAARQQALQMYLDHPELLRRSAAAYAESQRQQAAGVRKATWPGSRYAAETVASGLLDGLEYSPKLSAVAGHVRLLLDEDPDAKVIIFTGYREMLPFLAEAFHEYRSTLYHGQMTTAERAASTTLFGRDPNVRLLLSSHAGAYGLDLPMANWLINYDLALSHGRQSQINRRHVRAASRHASVHVVDVIMAGTVEERRRDTLRHEGRVAAATLDGTESDVGNTVQSLTANLQATLRVEALTQHN
jgi:SNF2 family DNA or RNA helicase